METIYKIKKVSSRRWDILSSEGKLVCSGKIKKEAIAKLFSNTEELKAGTIVLTDEENRIIKSKLLRPLKVYTDKAENGYIRAMVFASVM